MDLHSLGGQLNAHFSGMSGLKAEHWPTLPLFRLGKLAPISLNACMLRIETSYSIKIDHRMDLHVGISDAWLSPEPQTPNLAVPNHIEGPYTGSRRIKYEVCYMACLQCRHVSHSLNSQYPP